MFYPFTIQQRLWISSFVPCALLDSGIQWLTRHSPCPHRPAELVLTTHFIFNYLILVMIQTTSEKNGDQQGMWMGALAIARWQPQEAARMKSEPRAWVRGRVFNCSVLGVTVLVRVRTKWGFFSCILFLQGLWCHLPLSLTGKVRLLWRPLGSDSCVTISGTVNPHRREHMHLCISRYWAFWFYPHCNPSVHVYELNCFSHVWLCMSLWTAACQVPLPVGFPGREYPSG